MYIFFFLLFILTIFSLDIFLKVPMFIVYFLINLFKDNGFSCSKGEFRSVSVSSSGESNYFLNGYW